MGRTKTSGIRTDAAGNKIVDKWVNGERIAKRLGTVSQEQAEAWLAERIQRTTLAKVRGSRPRVTFREAAVRFLRDYRSKLASIDDASWHVELLDPWIGDKAIDEVHDETLLPFKNHRLQVGGVSLTTVNRSIEIARRILNLCARSWRHPNGLTWLEVPPLITVETQLARKQARRPYPLSWDEQDLLFAELPEDPNSAMALFKVNTGTREQEVCNLRWQWEIPVPELKTSVFLVPGHMVKNGEDRLIVMNQVAKDVVDARRGIHADFVFTYRRPQSRKHHERPPGPNKAVGCMNNNAWQHARIRAAVAYAEKFGRPAPAGFASIRVHDLKHTFGRRLRAAGVGEETRKVLLGHSNGDITSHYSAAEMAELITAVNKIDRTLATPAITMLRVAA